jgi:hypothetical protein
MLLGSVRKRRSQLLCPSYNPIHSKWTFGSNPTAGNLSVPVVAIFFQLTLRLCSLQRALVLSAFVLFVISSQR